MMYNIRVYSTRVYSTRMVYRVYNFNSRVNKLECIQYWGVSYYIECTGIVLLWSTILSTA